MNMERSINLEIGKYKNLEKKRIVIVTHRFVASPGDDLFFYLIERSAESMYIMHSFAERKDRRSFKIMYNKKGKIRGEQTIDYSKLSEPLTLIKNFLITIWWIASSQTRWDLYLGVDGFSSFSGLLLKKVGLVKQVAFWTTDFVPKGRFGNAILNILYAEINKYTFLRCDYPIDLSPRMQEARQKYYKKNEQRKTTLVPIGVWSKKRGLTSIDKISPHRLVFLGVLYEKQGVQLVLEAIPKIVTKIPDFEFHIIGTGPYEKTLHDTTTRLNIGKWVKFYGMVTSHKKVDEILAESAIAVAPYDISKDTWTYWADPGKLKNYLAASLPIILTKVSHNAEEIETKNCGLLINYNESELINAINKLMLNEELLRQYRKNAYQYSIQFDWEEIFNNFFKKIGFILKN